jgi:hypothetical protein
MKNGALLKYVGLLYVFCFVDISFLDIEHP